MVVTQRLHGLLHDLSLPSHHYTYLIFSSIQEANILSESILCEPQT